jgi:hypothetical protein
MKCDSQRFFRHRKQSGDSVKRRIFQSFESYHKSRPMIQFAQESESRMLAESPTRLLEDPDLHISKTEASRHNALRFARPQIVERLARIQREPCGG